MASTTWRRLSGRAVASASSPLAVAALALAGLTACGVLDPVPTDAGTTRLWPPQRPASTPTQAQRSTTADTAPSAADAAGACSAIDSFVGGLGSAMCEADQRRLAYLGRSAAVVNGVANYNAALWPLGAAAVHEKLRGAPNRNLLLPATLAAAAYGFVNAGIPAREKVYIEASRQLACAFASAAPDLYLPSEIDPAVAMPHQSPPALRPALSQLGMQIRAYERARVALLADLQPRAGSAAVAAPRNGNVFDKYAAQGGGRAAVKGDDKREQVAAQTRARLVHARAQLAAGQALLQRLDSGAPATALRGRMAAIDAIVHQQLAEAAPKPTNPASAAADFKGIANAIVTLQASIDATAPVADSPPDPLEAALPAALYGGLDTTSADALRQFQKTHAADLRMRVQDVADWLARHAAVRQEAAQTWNWPAARHAARTPRRARPRRCWRPRAGLPNVARPATRPARPGAAPPTPPAAASCPEPTDGTARQPGAAGIPAADRCPCMAWAAARSSAAARPARRCAAGHAGLG